jgi:hypothetical protein
VTSVGEYRDIPTNPVAVTGGAGTGATLNVIWAPYTGASELEVILQGIGSGSDQIYVGFKTYQQVNGLDTGYNWTLNGMTAFNSNLNYENQPNCMPTGPIPTVNGGAYVPLKPSTAFNMNFWFSITGRRIIGVANVQTATTSYYVSWYLGFQNPFGTSTEFPYPIYICGSTSRHDCIYFTLNPSITGLTEMVGIQARSGPGWFRQVDNTWQPVRNSVAVDTGSPTRAIEQNYNVYPCGLVTNAPATVDQCVGSSNGFQWDSIIPQAGIPGTATLKLMPTPNTAGALHLLVPATLCSSNGTFRDVLGELDTVYWLSASGGIASEDTVTLAGVVYKIFQNGNRITEFSFMAIKQG